MGILPLLPPPHHLGPCRLVWASPRHQDLLSLLGTEVKHPSTPPLGYLWSSIPESVLTSRPGHNREVDELTDEDWETLSLMKQILQVFLNFLSYSYLLTFGLDSTHLSGGPML